MSGRYLVNQGDKHMLTTCIKHLIENTQRYIKVSSFLMQDATISEMLKELALSGKAAVFLISNKKDQETEEYRESTILPNAAPIMIPTAMSITFPRKMKSRSSFPKFLNIINS